MEKPIALFTCRIAWLANNGRQKNDVGGEFFDFADGYFVRHAVSDK